MSNLAHDLAAVARIGAVPMILELVCRTTGLGFSAVARSAREHLFQPFSRPASQPEQRGLGLGLYIAAEVARAHGTLAVDSSPERTHFTFRMPIWEG